MNDNKENVCKVCGSPRINNDVMALIKIQDILKELSTPKIDRIVAWISAEYQPAKEPLF